MSRFAQFIQEFEAALARAPEWFQDLFGGTTIWDALVSNGLQVFGVGMVGWMLAAWLERRHHHSMDIREVPLRSIAINNCKDPTTCEPEASTLLSGSVVVAHDYFRTLIIFFRKLVGGNIRPYERLVHRGRREALIRLKEEADLRGLNKVINVRFTSTLISGRFLNAVEMVAYGTGVRVRTDPSLRIGSRQAESQRY